MINPDKLSAAAPAGLLSICDWATDLGRSDERPEAGQLLEIDMNPRPTQVKKTRAATGRSLMSNGQIGADLLHVPAGEGFAPHTHPGDHLLFVLGGEGTITVDGVILPTRAGQAYMIEGAVPHAVGAVTDHVILAIGSPHRELDSEERQSLVAYSALLAPIGSIRCLICDVSGASGEELADAGCSHSPHRFL